MNFKPDKATHTHTHHLCSAGPRSVPNLFSCRLSCLRWAAGPRCGCAKVSPTPPGAAPLGTGLRRMTTPQMSTFFNKPAPGRSPSGAATRDNTPPRLAAAAFGMTKSPALGGASGFRFFQVWAGILRRVARQGANRQDRPGRSVPSLGRGTGVRHSSHSDVPSWKRIRRDPCRQHGKSVRPRP